MRFGFLSLNGLIVFFLLFSMQTLAEYRVFLLNIVTQSPTPGPRTEAGKPGNSQSVPQNKSGTATNSESDKKPNLRQVKSSLDPHQYVRYYPLAANETISYTETWMCKGNTSGERPYCDNPKDKTRTPASRPDPDSKP